MSRQNALAYLETHHQRFIDELHTFLSIPSISTEPDNSKDVQQCAQWLETHLQTVVGFDTVRTYQTDGHPIVYAEWLNAGSDKPTILFYGHYDVQPVDPLNLWTNPPFEPTVRDGKIYARGATDDKGQVFLHLKCLESWLQTAGTLPVNVKVLIEGEEEIGSPNLEHFLRNHKEMLACESVVISDTAMYKKGQPSIVYGLRGLCYMEVHVTGPNRDLHSGSFGGGVQNPANALATIISKLIDDNGVICIPGFYDAVVELDESERAQYASLDFDENEFKRSLEIHDVVGEKGYTTLERLSGRPTLDVNGIVGGFTGVGAKTVLPSKASAKISMRLVANQDTEDIADKFTRYIQSISPKGVTVTIESLHGANPVLVPRQGRSIHAAQRALKIAFGVEPVFTREGGSIPITLLFDTILSAPTVLMGFGLNSENLHSPDEHFDLENFALGMKASAIFYDEVSAPTHE